MMRDAWWRRRGAETALVVPVAEAEPVVEVWRSRYDPTATQGMPAHITLLYPFIPARDIDATVELDLRSVLGAFRPFAFALTAVGRFPGVVYLEPNPAEPFIELTRTLWARSPGHPPYRNAYETIVPHLTVADGTEPDGLAEALQLALPITTTATEVWLMAKGTRARWSMRHRLALGVL